MKIDELIQLMEAVNKNKIDRFVYKNESGEKVSIVKNGGLAVNPSNASNAQTVLSASVIPRQISEVSGIAPDLEMKSDKLITSPLVGTFYTAPAPGKDSFVKVGDTVKVGQVVGIIEAMKLMNEVESEVEGVIEEILISDEEVVEYNQPLFRVR